MTCLHSTCDVNSVSKKEIREDVFFHHMKIMTEELSDTKSKGRELANKDLSKATGFYMWYGTLSEARAGFMSSKQV